MLRSFSRLAQLLCANTRVASSRLGPGLVAQPVASAPVLSACARSTPYNMTKFNLPLGLCTVAANTRVAPGIPHVFSLARGFDRSSALGMADARIVGSASPAMASMSVRNFAANNRKKRAPVNRPKKNKTKIKPYTGYKKRFWALKKKGQKLQFKGKRGGRTHLGHNKTPKQRRQLDRPLILKDVYAKVMIKLGFRGTRMK